MSAPHSRPEALAGQNSLDLAFSDFLLGDTQFQHELVPVENYWPQYMDKLEGSACEVMQGMSSVAQQHHQHQHHHQAEGLIPSYKAQEQREQQSVSYTFTPPNPVVMNVPQNQGPPPPSQFARVQPQHPAQGAPDTMMHGQEGFFPFNQGMQPHNATSGIAPQQGQATMDACGAPEAQGHGKQGSGSGTRERARNLENSGDSYDSLNGGHSKQKDNKSLRQRLLNQQAQQRYRQRKKEKGAEMQKTIDDMSAKIQELLLVKKDKEALEVKAKQFEDKLVEKEAEIVQLRSELQALRSTGTVARANQQLQDSVQLPLQSDQDKAEEDDEIGKRLMELPSLDDVVSNDELVQKLLKQFEAKHDLLKNFMQERNLLMSSGIEPIANDVSIEVKTKIREMVNGTMLTCLQIMSLQSVDVWEAIRASHDRAALHQREHWIHFVRSMRFNQQQRATLLQVRKQYIDNLERIFVERQSLNLQTISVLLPQQHGGNAPAIVGTTGRFNLKGYFQRSKQRAKMGGLLEALKLNLKKEQVAVAKLDYWLFNRVLNPLQASWFVFECYPQHCDSLALLNAVYEAYSTEAPQDDSVKDEPLSIAYEPETCEPMYP